MDLHLHSPLTLIDALPARLRREQPTHDCEHDFDGGLCQRAGLRGLLHQQGSAARRHPGAAAEAPQDPCASGCTRVPTATDMTAGSTAPLADAMDSAATIVTAMRW